MRKSPANCCTARDVPTSRSRLDARHPTPNNRFDHQFTWAEDFTAYKPISEPAAQTIVRMAKKYPGELVLLAVGPLQNVADALRLEPQLGKYLKRVVLMSGNVYRRADKEGIQPEWNVVASTQDAQLVYGAGLTDDDCPSGFDDAGQTCRRRARPGSQTSFAGHTCR